MEENLIEFTDSFEPELNAESSLIRGLIINALTMLERTIDAFLCKHFCGDKEKSIELLTHVFGSKYITFESKRLIFNSVTNNHHKDYKELNLNKIHSSLDRFNKIRNTLAHCIIDIKPESIEIFKASKKVTFIKFENKIVTEVYSREDAAKIVNEIYDLIKPIGQIIQL